MENTPKKKGETKKKNKMFLKRNVYWSIFNIKNLILHFGIKNLTARDITM